VAGLTPSPCDIGELMSAYLDGELLPGELDHVVEHLGECTDCILEFRHLKEARAAVRTLPRLEVPERLLPSFHFGPELSAYLDGELPTEEQAVVFSHLQACDECRDELHELDAARTAVRSLPRLEPPVVLDVGREPRRARWQGRRGRAVAVAAGAAAAAVIAVGVAGNSAPEPTIDLDSFTNQHVARASVEAGFTVIPAVGPVGLEP
jgi:anti-sigma factor RsiW